MSKQLDLEAFIARGQAAQAAVDRAVNAVDCAAGEAERARDAALARTKTNNAQWTESAILTVEGWVAGWTGTGENIRHAVESIAGEPGHPNAWGMLVRILLKRGIIVRTGRYLKMQDKKSHARMTPEYRRAEN